MNQSWADKTIADYDQTETDSWYNKFNTRVTKKEITTTKLYSKKYEPAVKQQSDYKIPLLMPGSLFYSNGQGDEGTTLRTLSKLCNVDLSKLSDMRESSKFVQNELGITLQIGWISYKDFFNFISKDKAFTKEIANLKKILKNSETEFRKYLGLDNKISNADTKELENDEMLKRTRITTTENLNKENTMTIDVINNKLKSANTATRKIFQNAKWDDLGRVLITPAMASTILTSHNNKNRKIDSHHVNIHVDNIKQSRWEPAAANITFSRQTGELQNGQHRLTALLKAGTALPFEVCFDGGPNTLFAIDAGKARTTANQVQLSGIANASKLTTMVKLVLDYVYMHSQGEMSLKTSISGKDAYRSGLSYSNLITAELSLLNDALTMTKINRYFNIKDTGRAAAIYITLVMDYSKAIDFWDIMDITKNSNNLNIENCKQLAHNIQDDMKAREATISFGMLYLQSWLMYLNPQYVYQFNHNDAYAVAPLNNQDIIDVINNHFPNFEGDCEI